MKIKWNSKSLVRLGLASACTLAVALFLLSWRVKTHAQDNAPSRRPVPMTSDWSNRHMVYSAPTSMSQAWRLQAESRYLHQWTRRNAAALRAQGAR